MQRATVALALLALCLGATQAATITTELTKGPYKLFVELAKCAGIVGALSTPSAKVTIMAPTDAAITSFLKAAGLSAADVLKNEQLCDALAAYHIIPAVAKSTAITTKTVIAPTMIKGSTLKFNRVGGKVTVTDAQGNVATVLSADLPAGQSVIHRVDKVLLSRFVFASPAAALKFYGTRFSTLAAALTKAGLLSTVASPSFAGTVLAPGNRAFSRTAPAALTLPGGTLANVLKYHVLPSARTIPAGFASGRSYPTLLTGQSVRYNVATRKATINGRSRTIGTATFTSTSGNTATVLGHNVFAGKAVFHAINAVLMPAGPRTQERGTASAGHRHLLQEGADTQSMAIQEQMDAASDAIQWAATTGSAADATAATSSAQAGAEAVQFPQTGEAEW